MTNDGGQFGQCSSEELESALQRLTAEFNRLRTEEMRIAGQRRTAEKLIESIRREKEVRRALSDADVKWDVLLQTNLTDSIASQGLLATALQRFELYPIGEFYRESGQTVVGLKMVRDDLNQCARVARGMSALLPYMESIRGEKEFRILRPSLRRGQRYWLSVGRDETVSILGTGMQKQTFPDIDLALRYVQENLFWAETSTPEKDG